MFVRLYFVKDYLRCSSRKQECYLHLKLVIEYLDIVVRCIEYERRNLFMYNTHIKLYVRSIIVI